MVVDSGQNSYENEETKSTDGSKVTISIFQYEQRMMTYIGLVMDMATILTIQVRRGCLAAMLATYERERKLQRHFHGIEAVFWTLSVLV